jgi:hypothetical protein
MKAKLREQHLNATLELGNGEVEALRNLLGSLSVNAQRDLNLSEEEIVLTVNMFNVLDDEFDTLNAKRAKA